MRITLGVTDNDWAAFLRDDDSITEANFWVPSGINFRALSPGDVFLFKTKAPTPALVGGGTFEGFLPLRVSDAWNFFGRGNGVATEEALHAAIQTYRQARSGKPFVDDPEIGCIMLRDLFFSDEETGVPQPPGWSPNIVTWKSYSPGDEDWEYVHHCAAAMRSNVRIDIGWAARQTTRVDGPRYGRQRTVQSRLGQGAFRAHVSLAYDWRCAITGSQNAPALEAAHIRPYAHGGEHTPSNSLLLRRDAHTLFDRGYLGVDTNLKLHVSPRLKIDTANGVEFYERAAKGQVIRVPAREDLHPDRRALEWHMDEVFLGAS